jgi:Ricin-type beta-trefoil lectin domain
VKRLLAGLASAGLLAAAAVAGTAATADAATLASCSANGNGAHCTAEGKITGPGSLAFSVTASPNQNVIVGWAVGCAVGGTFKQTSGSFTGISPVTRGMSLPSTRQGTCFAAVDAGVVGSGSIRVAVLDNVTVLHQIKGFANLCADAKNNKAVLDACSGAASEQWTFSRGELAHGKSCMNDKNRKIVLSACNGGTSEIWSHDSRGEYVLKGGKLCLTDPNSAKRAGTQLVVAACRDAANQRWTQP